MPLSILNSDNVLNVGTVANDNTGDNLRTAGQKINTNFEDLDNAVAAIVSLPEATVINSTIRYDGAAYTSTDGLKVDASGNTTVAGTLDAGNTTITGALNADSATVAGTLDVTGTTSVADLSVTGDITVIGDVNGNVTGNLAGNVTGNVTGNLAGNVNGNVTGQVSDISNHSIDGLSDVDTTTEAPTTGQSLQWTGSKWAPAPVDTGVPSGTKQLFVQTAAPTGWTKDTTHNNKALRVVSGTAGSGGSDAFTPTFGSSNTTGSHTLTIAEMPSHAHENEIYNTNNGGGLAIETIGRANAAYIRDTTVMENEGGGGAHSHNLSDFDLQYVDVIIATKD